MATSAPPNIYDNMAGMQGAPAGAGAPAAGGPPGPGGAPGGDADGEILQAVAKIFSVLKKVPKMKDGTQPYIDRALAPLKEMVVDVLKKDPKDLDAAGGGDKSADAAAPDSPAAQAPLPGEAVPA